MVVCGTLPIALADVEQTKKMSCYNIFYLRVYLVQNVMLQDLDSGLLFFYDVDQRLHDWEKAV